MPQTRLLQPPRSSTSRWPADERAAPRPREIASPTLGTALAALRSASPAEVLQLQRIYGNRAVDRWIQRARTPVQRAAAVGMKGGEVGGDLQDQIHSARGGGQPLDRSLASKIGGALGADLSQVRVHTDSKSDTLNRSLGARAFALGSDVFFSQDAYNPATRGGQELLAHELTHVVQQGRAKANQVQGKLTVGPTGDRYEKEADWAAEQVTRSPALTPSDTKQLPAEMAPVELAGNKARTAMEAGPPCQAQGDVVQRDVPRQVAKPWWTLTRPASIQQIDTKLALLVDKMVTLPGAIDDIKRLITDVLKAISDFDSSKEKGGKWDENVRAVETEVRKKETEIDARIRDRTLGQTKYAEFQKLEPDLAQYAKRSMLSAPEFEPTAMSRIASPSVKNALTRPRGTGGELTAEAIEEMNRAQQSEIVGEKKTTGRDVTFAGIKISDLRNFMDAHKNTLTGKTEYPELRNITDPLDPLTHPDNVVTTDVDISGVTMPVEHNQSDVNYAERLKLLQDAVAKIAAKSITVPALRVHMPKYGRGLKLKATSGVSGTVGCEVESKSSRAVFIPPDFMHLSSEVIGTPNLTQVTNPVSKAKEYQFSSTGFDPSGVATIVHEFGHALHYTNAPGKFHGLWGTSFKDVTSSLVAISQVSQYGSKPREFVAEVFLGLMYDKVYSDEVLKMYKAFGGSIPPAMTGRFASL